MRDLSTLTFHPTAQKIVEVLCEKTQNANPHFFRIMVCYYICKMAATMRVSILTKDRGNIPVNLYGINLSGSGSGKGFSTNIIEDQLIQEFRSVFNDITLPSIAEQALGKLAVRRAAIKGEDPDKEIIRVTKEYNELGKMAFSFDSATTAAVKQMRHKLLMATAGSINFECDEIGSNLLSNAEVLSTFLELYDVGKIKQKLTKNTKENIRSEEIEGRTPTNLILFGTPAKLFDGSKIEDEFWSFITTGYGRRCFFGYAKGATKMDNLTAEDIYNHLTNKSSAQLLKDLAKDFAKLADETNFQKVFPMSKDVSLHAIEYRMHCEAIADSLGDHEEMRKIELTHRYFKAIKLAGGFAFIDNAAEISEDNLYHAIYTAEQSGKAYELMLNQDKNYVKLAKYIAAVNQEITHVDLCESLPFYKGSAAQKADMMQLATAWGYKNSIIIKHKIDNNIEFIRGEALEKTNLEELYVAYSDDVATGYKNGKAPFDKLSKLLLLPHNHWINHHTTTGRRQEEHLAAGCNMVVLDIDSGITIDRVKLLLADYKYIIQTTKRHTPANNRFRVILPLSYIVKLNEDDFKEFMANIFSWLPFDSDTATGQRSRKWLTNDKAQIYINDGNTLVDSMLFIPKTSKNDECKKTINSYQELSNVERWFILNSKKGNRNNQLLRYALMLIDFGYDVAEVRLKVDLFNNKLPTPLTDSEITSTIMVSVNRRFIQKGRE